MRVQFCDALVNRSRDQGMLFLTGDLGFMALEPLQSAMGSRFINAGVAEQNMVSVSAGLSRQGFEVWVYSIAPFCYARPFEQIRNDVAFHQLPVKLVGNGGGYGYGVMGPTHHAIEDYGVLLTLPNFSAYVPAFDEDLAAVVPRAGASRLASYLRLGRGEKPKGFTVPSYAPWRQLTWGEGPVVIALGPLAGSYIEPFERIAADKRPKLWVNCELPLSSNPLPAALREQLSQANLLIVAEEHVQRGSFGAELALESALNGLRLPKMIHCHARAHHFPRYGSQVYLRRKSGLDAQSVVDAFLAR